MPGAFFISLSVENPYKSWYIYILCKWILGVSLAMDMINTIDVLISEDGSITIENKMDLQEAIFATRIVFIRLRENSGRERLKVEIYEHNAVDPYATTYIGNSTLERDIVKLCEYGAFLSRKSVMEVVKQIKADYNKMAVMTDSETQTIEADLLNIVRYICGYIFQQGIKAVRIKSDELYNIPVGDFSDLIENSPFCCYSLKSIKQRLNDMGYIACSSGRTDNTIKVNGKAIKVVSFYADGLVDIAYEDIAE